MCKFCKKEENILNVKHAFTDDENTVSINYDDYCYTTLIVKQKNSNNEMIFFIKYCPICGEKLKADTTY